MSSRYRRGGGVTIESADRANAGDAGDAVEVDPSGREIGKEKGWPRNPARSRVGDMARG
jgi:hypothetical protein